MEFVLSNPEASAQREAGIATVEVCLRSQGKTHGGPEGMCILLFYFPHDS